MKKTKIFRILGVTLILSLLLTIVPALPVFAVDGTSLSVSTGRIGDSVTVYGSFTSSSQERWANVFFSPNNIEVLGSTTLMTTYKLVGGADIPITGETNAGNFTVTFTVPESLTDGTVAQNVTSGTYYVYTTVDTIGTPGTTLRTKSTFVVTVPALDTPSPTSGPPGTLVVITGSNFPASTAITLQFGTTNITPVSGTTTYSNGTLLTSFNVPADATSGAHTITVTAGTSTASTTFTVTAPAALGALNPTSGPPGSYVAISGTNFPISTLITFTFDSTVLQPTGSSSTGPAGSFASVLIIPATATAGAHTITVTVGSTVKTATFTVTGATTPIASLSALNPSSGPPGTNVAISGANFTASSNITITFGTTVLTLSGSTQTTASGTFSSTIVIPSNATAGVHTISVTIAGITKTANFTVTTSTTTPPTSPAPTDNVPINFSQSGDTVGATITVAAGGFTPNSTITIKFDDIAVATVTADASGFFVAPPFQVPSSQHGEHTVTATDGTHTGSKTFTLESTVPDIPLPLSPLMEETVAAPAYFDWSDVTDASMPVTYNLQIATTKTFDADSILINKTGLTKSEYTLTETEQLKLTSDMTYYWREQAVDAALNESSWTGAGEFSVIKPFEFIGWPLYLTIGIGGLVLFLLGMWVGRRMAFYY